MVGVRVLALVLCGLVSAEQIDCTDEDCTDENVFLQPTSKRVAETEKAPCSAPVDPGPEVWLTDVIDLTLFGAANASYPGLYLPDTTKPLEAFSRNELLINKALGGRHTGLVAVFFGALQAFVQTIPPPQTWDFYTYAGQKALQILESAGGSSPALQGANSEWEKDTFASDFIAHTYMSMFLEKSGDELVLDLSGANTESKTIQKLKQQIVRTFPPDLLKSRAFFKAHQDRLELLRIEVLSPDGSTETVAAAQSTQWQLAKMIFASSVTFVFNLWHVCVHAYSSAVTVAAQRSLPRESKLNGMMDPGALRNVAVFIEGIAVLHSDHGAAWSGSVYKSNITEVRAATVDVVQFFMKSELPEIINCEPEQLGQPCNYPWWAGGGLKFVEPVQQFAESIASSLASEGYLEDLEKQLQLVGFSEEQVTSQAGLAKFLTNLIFIQSVVHSYSVSQRENIGGYGGFPHDAALAPLLQNNATSQMNLSQAIHAVMPYPDAFMVQGVGLSFPVSIGLLGGPHLGDGPFYTQDDANLQQAIAKFRSSLASVQQQIQDDFCSNGCSNGVVEAGRFLPSWFYSRETQKPYGYMVTSTVYA